jgi:hypothetical protein
MRENYKILFLSIIIILSLFKIASSENSKIESNEIENKKKRSNKKNEQRAINEQKVIININIYDKIPQNIAIFANSIIDSNQEFFLKNKNIKMLEVTEDFENNSILNYFALGIDALINITIKNVDNSCRIDFICYSSPSSILFEDNISFAIKDNINDITEEEKETIENKIRDFFSTIGIKLFEKRQRTNFVIPK